MKTLGRFELHETLGAGAMSTVYRAVDTRTGEVVALKVLHPHLAAGDSLARFEREAHALASLDHPHIIRIREFGRGEDGQPYIVLEHVEGFSLASFLARRREVPPDLAAMILLDLARAVAAAHSKGIVHRDLKPENVLVGKDGSLKISDFGLAHLWEGEDLTRPGTRVGSPAYMSPEQILGERPCPAMDVFSLGILFHLLLTGELPFAGRNRKEVFDLILHRKPRPPSEVAPGIPAALSELCERMIHRTRPDRLVSADALASSLERYLGEVALAESGKLLSRYLLAPKEQWDEVRKGLLDAYLLAASRALEKPDKERALEILRMILVLTGFRSGPDGFGSEAAPTKKVRLRPALWARVRRWLK